MYASPAGSLSNYQTVVDNFANLAEAAAEVGVAGIFFDSEEYFGDTWSPEVLGPGRPLSSVQADARAWGKKMMQAMVSRWPSVKFLVTIGPWASDRISADPPSTGALGEACGTLGGACATGGAGGKLAAQSLNDSGSAISPRAVKG